MKIPDLNWPDVVNKDGTYLLRISIEYPKNPYDPILVERIYRKVRNRLVEVIEYGVYATTWEIQRSNVYRTNFQFMSAKQVSEMIEKSKKTKYWGEESEGED